MSNFKKLNRKYDKKEIYKTIYIFTEGKETEPNYFNSIRKELKLLSTKVEIFGLGDNTLSLVNRVIEKIENQEIKSDEVWVVFDKDDFDKYFDAAIKKAEKNNIKVAYSNECFELWFLLHFCYIDSALHRDILNHKLNSNLLKNSGKKYHKSLSGMYLHIKDSEKTAIKRAKKLLSSFGDEKSHLKKNPSTTVHLLVESLNNLKN